MSDCYYDKRRRAPKHLFAVNDEPLLRLSITISDIASFEPAMPVEGSFVSFRVKIAAEDSGTPNA